MRFSPEAGRPRTSRPLARELALARALAFAIALALAGCGGAGAPTITVADAWVRAPTGTGSLTAAYFTITNTGSTADTLLSVTCPAATMAMVHQSTTDPDGMTAMLPVPRLVVGPSTTTRFEPGGLHVMLEGLPTDMAVGATVELDLQFEHAGTIKVQASVRSG